LLPNLAGQVRNRITAYNLEAHARDVVPVMQKHMLSLRPYAIFRERISEYVRTTYEETHRDDLVLPMPDGRDVLARAAE
jgi:hypothetical protein